MLHLALHVLVPLATALLFYRKTWKKALLMLLAGILIDLDHLLVTPIYDPGRCSIAFHPLHSYPAITLYATLAVIRKTRIWGIGLMIHIVLDILDCLF